MFKKTPVVMLPTEKASNIQKWGVHLIYNEKKELGNRKPTPVFQHLYFLSDEEIKEGDWKYNPTLNHIVRHIIYSDGDKKIIASTDKSLGLPRPSDKFIQKYCELGGIDSVMIEYEYKRSKKAFFYLHNELELDSTLKVAPDNTITIKSVKDSWNRAEMFEFAKRAYDEGYENGYGGSDYAGGKYRDEWIEENL